VLFVALGAIGTLFFSSAIPTTDVPAQQATVVTASSTSIQINCEDPLQYGSNTCSETVDKRPPVAFDVSGERLSLSGSVRVAANVLFAQKVKLLVRSEATGLHTALGFMTSGTSSTWEYFIDTTKLQDGKYFLKVLVENTYGTYEAVDQAEVIIHNQPIPAAILVATTTVEEQADTLVGNDVVAQKSDVLLTTVHSTNEDEFRFEIATLEAETVKLYVTQEINQKEVFLGVAYKASAGLWKYLWNTSDYATGIYKIRAQVIKNNLSIVSNTLSVEKKDQQVVPPVVPISTTPTPPVSIAILSKNPVEGIVGVQIEVADADKVLIYAEKKGTLTEKYLGTAKKIDADTWTYFVDTNQMPNGEYRFISAVTNIYGSYKKSSEFVSIVNSSPELTREQKEAVTRIETTENEIQTTSAITSSANTEVKPVFSVPEYFSTSEDVASSPKEILTQDVFDLKLKRLAAAVRFGDLNAINALKTEMSEFIAIEEGQENEEYELLKTKFIAYVNEAIKKVEEKVAATNKLFEERTNEKITQDSDDDGVTDYDEVSLFNTNPFSADSDSDGFLDGIEIEAGYDPTDSKSEALMVYESPKDTGLERPELLEVISIASAPAILTDGPERVPSAIISGKGLPNSFVSLYIFSTPIVVTVKTESDGSWVYRFDKELEDGQHEVYIGMTDNSGKIIAKSKPFSFVKEAEAFTGTTDPSQVAEAPTSFEPSHSFLSEYTLYLVLSISVVAIGLVLILLGLHLEARTRKIMTSASLDVQEKTA
jgi:hypothetical protein